MANKYELRRRARKEAKGRPENPFAAPRHGGGTQSHTYTPPPPMDRRGITLALSLGLVVLITALYVQTAGHKFTVCDDNVYIYKNPQVIGGLTQHLEQLKNHFLYGKPEKLSDMPGNAVVWAFADAHKGNWHPLTWISHMLDFQVFGTWQPENQRYVKPWAGGHHLVSMAIHCVNAVLLFLALRLMTGTLWPSFVVAALFGIHPLRVESVAWAAERKDVLCGLFWMASLLAYAWYARRPPVRPTSFFAAVGIAAIIGIVFIHMLVWPDLSVAPAVLIAIAIAGMLFVSSLTSGDWLTRLAEIGSYLLITLLFALGLMAKSMIVTLPCVFMLLDIWPLRRWKKALWPPGRRDPQPDFLAVIGLLVEKVPWFALALGDGFITYYGQKKGVALNSFEGLPLGPRLLNAVVACGEYLRQTVWPTGLAPFYTHPAMIPDGWTPEFYAKVYIYAPLLAAITFAAIWFLRQRPFLAVGWFWFLGALVPVIGIIQVGTQSRADRYTYLPMIGVYLMVAWLLMEVANRWPRMRVVLAASSVVVLMALSAVTFRQVSYWVDSYKLFEHGVQVTERNYFAYNHIGIAYDSDGQKMSSGDAKEAKELFDHLAENFKGPPEKLDDSLKQPLLLAGSAENFKEATKKLNLQQKQQLLFDYSADAFQATIDIKPDYDFGNNNLGVYYARKNKPQDLALAEKYFRGALMSNQSYADAYNNLGIILMREHKYDESILVHKMGLAVRLDEASDHNNLCRVYMLRHHLEVEKGELDRAKDDLDNALKENAFALEQCDPNFLGAWASRAEIFIVQKNLDGAAACIRKMTTIDARSPETLQALFIVVTKCLELTRPDVAIDLLSRSLESNDADPRLYNLRAHAYLQKSDWNHAKDDFEQVLRLAPQFPEAQEKLNAVRAKLANPERN